MTGLTRRDRELFERDEEILRQRRENAIAPVSSGMSAALLKEAIEDAKAVKATALANARQALEEAFSKRFEDMFMEKLKQIKPL